MRFVRYSGTLIFFAVALISCSIGNKQREKLTDPHSFANINEISIQHLDMDLKLDFNKKTVSGKITYFLDNKTKTDKLILDTKDLTIRSVKLNDGSDAEFSLGKRDEVYGTPLTIKIKPSTKSVTIDYITKSSPEAIQFLSPELTADGKEPYLYTDEQPILTRTWFPCMDSPSIRQTYRARVQTKPGLMVVMSGQNSREKNPDGVYEIYMDQPIPSYLIALASGDFDYKKMGRRTGVYAEPSVIDKAAWEFAETEKFMDAAESLYGPYRWEDYNIVVMPPSYPLGGMENPRITFATPTVIAGDRSLVALIAHELAHSWSGNLVTNANWTDFWLNEGVTTYIEHRLMETVYGKKYDNMLKVLDYQNLEEEVNKLGKDNPLTKLHLNLEGKDPEGTAGLVAYEKGAYFLFTLEKYFGRKKFDAFLKNYFDHFAFQTSTTEKFTDYLRKHLIQGDQKAEKDLKIDEWLYGTGIPSNIVHFKSEEFKKVENELNDWENGTLANKLDVKDWKTPHWMHFLRHLPKNMTIVQMKDLDKAFDFTNSGNSEIVDAWLVHAIHNNYTPAFKRLNEFLNTVGRTKFLRPLYGELSKTPEGLKRAKEIYASAKHIYHTNSKRAIEKILNKNAD